MNVDVYKRRLLAEEWSLVSRIERAVGNARDRDQGTVGDSGDASAETERGDQQLSEAQTESSRLAEVRAALARIEAGTFGTCAVDGEPIEDKRLEAIPWAAYCLKHAARMEGPVDQRTTL